jgi:hypothetical protein
MNTTASTAVVFHDPELVDPEHVPSAATEASHARLRPGPPPVRRVLRAVPPWLVRDPLQRHRELRMRARSPRSCDGCDRQAAMHDHLVLLVRGRRPHRALPAVYVRRPRIDLATSA